MNRQLLFNDAVAALAKQDFLKASIGTQCQYLCGDPRTNDESTVIHCAIGGLFPDEVLTRSVPKGTYPGGVCWSERHRGIDVKEVPIAEANCSASNLPVHAVGFLAEKYGPVGADDLEFLVQVQRAHDEANAEYADDGTTAGSMRENLRGVAKQFNLDAKAAGL